MPSAPAPAKRARRARRRQALQVAVGLERSADDSASREREHALRVPDARRGRQIAGRHRSARDARARGAAGREDALEAVGDDADADAGAVDRQLRSRRVGVQDRVALRSSPGRCDAARRSADGPRRRSPVRRPPRDWRQGSGPAPAGARRRGSRSSRPAAVSWATVASVTALIRTYTWTSLLAFIRSRPPRMASCDRSRHGIGRRHLDTRSSPTAAAARTTATGRRARSSASGRRPNRIGPLRVRRQRTQGESDRRQQVRARCPERKECYGHIECGFTIRLQTCDKRRPASARFGGSVLQDARRPLPRLFGGS